MKRSFAVLPLFVGSIVCSVFSSHVAAESFSFYGKANVGLEYEDTKEDSKSDIKSYNSRLGLKGNHRLDNGFILVYRFEFQVDMAGNSGSDNIKGRNQYVGVQGEFGTVLLGRNDTMLKQSQGRLDQFNDFHGDLKVLWKGENRLDNTLTYLSPMFGEFRLGMTYIAEGDDEGEDGTSLIATYGDIDLKTNDWFASLAADFDVAGYDIVRASVYTKWNDFKFGASLQQQEAIETGSEKDGFMLNGAYRFGKVVLKTQYQTLEDDDAVSLGADYKLGENTRAYIWYTDKQLDQSNDTSRASIGLEHKF